MDITPNSCDSFKYLLICMRIVGAHPTVRFRYVYYFYAFLFNLTAGVLFQASFLANLFFMDDIGDILSMLSMGVNIVSGTLKTWTIILKRSNFEKMRELLVIMDSRLSSEEEKEYVRLAIKLNHRIFAAYFILYTIVVWNYAITSLISRKQLLFSTWLPFDWQASPGNYWIAFFYQFFFIYMQLIQDLLNDGYPQIYLNALVAHYRALFKRIGTIGNNPKKTYEDNYNQLVESIYDHKILVEYYETIRPIITITIFFQFLVTALILCFSVVTVMFFDRNLFEIITAVSYLGAIILQVLPCCYYVDEFIIVTGGLTDAIFKCNWMGQNQKFRKAMIIFMQRTQKKNTIMAGNLVPITLESFLMIIKFSFSLFIVLSRLKH